MAKLGSEKNPAVLRVQSQEKAANLLKLCEIHGWKAIVEIEPGQPEDTDDLDYLFSPQEPITKHFKVGRNDPCPCGSLKKYKRCCEPKGLDVEELLRNRLRDMVTRDDVEQDSTPEIVRKLSEIGVRSISHEDFLKLAEGSRSAFRVYEAWSDEVTRKLTFHEDSYLIAAAEVLWRRWCPHETSITEFSDWVNEAAELEQDDKDTEALDLYWKAWQFLNAQFTHELVTFDDAQELLDGTDFFFSNLISDIETAFSWQALKLEKYQDMAVAYCTQVIEQFADGESENLEHIRLKLAEAHWFKGDEGSAETVYREMMDKHPRRSAGYIGWSDALTTLRRFLGKPENSARAKEILEQAKESKVVDGPDWDLDVRLQDLLSGH